MNAEAGGPLHERLLAPQPKLAQFTDWSGGTAFSISLIAAFSPIFGTISLHTSSQCSLTTGLGRLLTTVQSTVVNAGGTLHNSLPEHQPCFEAFCQLHYGFFAILRFPPGGRVELKTISNSTRFQPHEAARAKSVDECRAEMTKEGIQDPAPSRGTQGDQLFLKGREEGRALLGGGYLTRGNDGRALD